MKKLPVPVRIDRGLGFYIEASECGQSAQGPTVPIQVVVDGKTQFLNTLAIANWDARKKFASDAASGLGISQIDLEAALTDFYGALQDTLAMPDEEMTAHAAPGGEPEYSSGPDGLRRMTCDSQGKARFTHLTNFDARICEEVTEDDGVESRKVLRMQATIGSRRMAFALPATKFGPMNWPIENLGSEAILYPGTSTREHARTAIQVLSGLEGISLRQVFSHTGWRKVDGNLAYLHAGGAIGAIGAIPGVEVGLDGKLAAYRLPAPPDGDELIEAVRSSLEIADLVAEHVAIPILGAAYRAPMGPCGFSLNLSGETGKGKSVVAGLAQQHYGPEMDHDALPESWTSTSNALELHLNRAKDTITVIDDFVTKGGPADVQRIHGKADRVLRAVGNQSSRSRLDSSLTARPSRPPRGLAIVTGEEIPQGHSLRARMLLITVKAGDVPLFLAPKSLTGPSGREQRFMAIQKKAKDGILAAATAGYLRWLAPQYDALRSSLESDVDAFRRFFAADHARTAGIMAHLAYGWHTFLTFAVDIGALTQTESNELMAKVKEALKALALAQADLQAESDPVDRYFEILAAALASGRAHVSPGDGISTLADELWGYRKNGEDWVPQGKRIGWREGENVYLLPAPTYAVVSELASAEGEPIAIGAKSLGKRLAERGKLASTETRRKRNTIHKTIGGGRPEVYHVLARTLLHEEIAPIAPDTEVVAGGADLQRGDLEMGRPEPGEESPPWGDLGGSPWPSGDLIAPAPNARSEENVGMRGAVGAIPRSGAVIG